jgi:hypothetical protein
MRAASRAALLWLRHLGLPVLSKSEERPSLRTLQVFFTEPVSQQVAPFAMVSTNSLGRERGIRLVRLALWRPEVNMQRRRLPVLPALMIGFTVLAFASPALAQDPYCARAYPQQDVYVDGYGSYGYASPYVDGYGSYGYRSNGYASPYVDGYGSYGYGSNAYARPYDDYRANRYGGSQYGYSRRHSPSYGGSYGYRNYGRGAFREHRNRTFNPFPLRRFDERRVRGYRPY